MPDFRRNEALSFIKGGLQDVSLSRAKLEWGMPLPWDPSQRMYVWFDALLNYYTALGFAREGEDLTDRFWPAAFHLLAKDILKFHAVIWPALLMAADIEPPTGMVIHGYLLMGEKKMSKSLGNVLDPFDGDRALRLGRAALLLPARGVVRPGRFRVRGGVRIAGTRPSSRTTSATWRAGRSR